MNESSMLITVQYTKGVTCKLEVWVDNKVGDLQHDIYERCGVPTGDQRILCEGLPLPPEINLSSVGNGATLMVKRGIHGGAGTLSSGKKKGAVTLNRGKKKKR